MFYCESIDHINAVEFVSNSKAFKAVPGTNPVIKKDVPKKRRQCRGKPSEFEKSTEYACHNFAHSHPQEELTSYEARYTSRLTPVQYVAVFFFCSGS